MRRWWLLFFNAVGFVVGGVLVVVGTQRLYQLSERHWIPTIAKTTAVVDEIGMEEDEDDGTKKGWVRLAAKLRGKIHHFRVRHDGAHFWIKRRQRPPARLSVRVVIGARRLSGKPAVKKIEKFWVRPPLKSSNLFTFLVIFGLGFAIMGQCLKSLRRYWILRRPSQGRSRRVTRETVHEE